MKKKKAIILTVIFGIVSILAVIFSICGCSLIEGLLTQEADNGGEAVGVVIADIVLLPLGILLLGVSGLGAIGSLIANMFVALKSKRTALIIISIISIIVALVAVGFVAAGFLLLC